MTSLLLQSSQVADLLGGALYELSRDREQDGTVDFIDSRGCKTVKVTGETPKARRARALDAYRIELFELIFTPDGDEYFGSIDRQGVLRILEDPLSSPSRTARRNLLLASAIVFLMGATRQTPGKVPGFDFDLSGHPWIVGGLAISTLVYQCAAFGFYTQADSARRTIAEDEVGAQLNVLRKTFSDIRSAVEILEESEAGKPIAQATIGWSMHTKSELSRLEREWAIARHRRRWDLLLPIPLVVLAALAFLLEWLW